MASATERALRARIAATTRWAKTVDRSAATAPARSARRAKLALEVDPDGVLPEAERERRTDQLIRAQMLSASHAAAVARRKAREARETAARFDQVAAEAEAAAEQVAEQ